jgi:hypothetical protein
MATSIIAGVPVMGSAPALCDRWAVRLDYVLAFGL